jgi:hypothetical protein
LIDFLVLFVDILVSEVSCLMVFYGASLMVFLAQIGCGFCCCVSCGMKHLFTNFISLLDSRGFGEIRI